MPVRLRLDEILRERNMTQTALAEKSGLSYQTINSTVNQPAMIRMTTIDKLCDALDIEPKDLFVRVKIEPVN